jgi:hypothetical protein
MIEKVQSERTLEGARKSEKEGREKGGRGEKEGKGEGLLVGTTRVGSCT